MLQNLAWINDKFKVQDRPMDFNAKSIWNDAYESSVTRRFHLTTKL